MDTNKEIIRRFTSDKYTFNDYLSVSSYFREEKLNEGLKKNMEDEWRETENENLDQQHQEHLLNRLHHQINLNKSHKVNAFGHFYSAFSKVAAVLLVPALLTIAVLSYYSINFSDHSESWAEIHAPVGSRTEFQLPDGSHGWLNSGSSIKYPVNFAEHRNVEISGEAWFDVVHRNSEEFRVITPYFDVKVLGTQFNVIAYDSEETAEVILEMGKVQVLGKDDEVKGELKPDQKLVYNKLTKELITTSIDSKNYTSWKDGLLVFKNVSMEEIARRLERKYNTEIILHGDLLKSSVFRATFQDENLDEICKMLAIVAPIQYKIHKREKQPDNSFGKSKVEMWLK